MKNTKIDLTPLLLAKFEAGEVIDCDALMNEVKCRDQTIKRSICQLRDDGYLINTIEKDGKCYYKMVSKFKEVDAVLKDHKIGALKKYLESITKIKDPAKMANDIYRICHATREDLWKYTYSPGRLEQREQIGRLIEDHGGKVESITLDIAKGKFNVVATSKGGKKINATINAVR